MPTTISHEVRELKVLLGSALADDRVTDNGLARVLVECPDIDLAATALTMSPRPGWVAALVMAP